MNHTLAIGVTGGIGSGKTEVCRVFERLGAAVLSADTIAKDLLDNDAETKRRVIRRFGAQLYRTDGTLDRRQLAKLIFNDDAVKTEIEAIVHPRTLAVIEKEIEAARARRRPSLVVVEAALLFESGADAMVDYTIVVESDTERQLDRVVRRDAMTKTEVAQRMKAQLPSKDRAARADFVLHNLGSLAELEEKATFFYNLLNMMPPKSPDEEE